MSYFFNEEINKNLCVNLRKNFVKNKERNQNN